MKKGQTKLFSFIEVCLNTTIGYIIAITTQILIFPLFDIYITMDSNLKIGLLFTIVSIVRSYVMRRIFNYIGYR